MVDIATGHDKKKMKKKMKKKLGQEGGAWNGFQV